MKISFHARFTKPALISHFRPIDVKRETNGIFENKITYDTASKNDETRRGENRCSRFSKDRRRFTPFHVSFRAILLSQRVWGIEHVYQP